MQAFFKKYLWVILLGSIALLLCITNYTPGTYLSGWDTLHPEFNFSLNIVRLLTGVYRSEQGLGAIAAHSHMAEIPRVLILWIASFVFPTSFLRYFYIFLTLFVGPIGMYYFLKTCVFRAPETVNSFSTSHLASFLGALCYLLNLNTMQQFIVPFEMFNTLFAFLPWIMLVATKYLYEKQQSSRTLLYFCLLTFFSSPMAYAAILWYIYFGLLIVYLISLILFSANLKTKTNIKKIVMLMCITLVINAYWLLPNLYFLATTSKLVEQAYTNKLFSPQAFLYNKEFGNLPDLALQKSFLFDWNIYNSGTSGFEPLLKPWISHLTSPLVALLGYMFAGVSFIGAIYAIKKKQKILLASLPVLIIVLFFLINENFPTAPLYSLLENNVPLLKEALRFPHSKFYIHYTFIFSLFFSMGCYYCFQLIQRLSKKSFILIIYTFGVSLSLMYFMLPAFQGSLISKTMRIHIPNEYFQLFNWLDSQPVNGRVANLPINSFWGWDYYDWYGNSQPSFQGAGFLWFGIPQPVLHRDFDRWNPANFGYYQEMSYAIYTKNPELLEQVINKYNISYLLFDKSVIAPGSDSKILFRDQTISLLAQLSILEKPKRFGQDLFVYKVKSANPVFTFSPSFAINPSSVSQYKDEIFTNIGDYISFIKQDNTNNYEQINYPFRNISDNEGKIFPNLIKTTSDGISLHIPDTTTRLSSERYVSAENTIPAQVLVNRHGGTLSLFFYPYTPLESTIPLTSTITLPSSDTFIISINQKYIFSLHDLVDDNSYAIGKVELYTKKENRILLYPNSPTIKVIPDLTQKNYSLRPCDKLDTEQVFGITFEEKNSFSLSGKKTPICLIYPLESLLPSTSNQDDFLLTTTYSSIPPSGTAYAPSNLCLSLLENGSCASYISHDISIAPSNFSAAAINYFTVPKQSLNKYGLRAFFDTTYADTIIATSFQKLSFGVTQPLVSISIPALSSYSSLEEINSSHISSSLLFTFSGENQQSQDITTLPKSSGSCEENPFIKNHSSKQQLIQQGERYIRYSSEEGSICDHFSYQNLPQNQGYLLQISSRNVSGLPLNVCVTNTVSKRCDIYSRLSESSTFTTDTFILPPMSNSDIGYDVNIDNLGIKGTPGINDIQSIQFIPFPYNWFQTIVDAKNVASPPIAAPSHVISFTHPLQFLYIVNIPPSTQDTVATIPESSLPGWEVFKVKSTTALSRAFPFLFVKKIASPVIVNSWRYGWIVQNNSADQKFIVVFLPQYLEYLGLFLLPLPFVYWLYIWRLKKTKLSA